MPRPARASLWANKRRSNELVSGAGGAGWGTPGWCMTDIEDDRLTQICRSARDAARNCTFVQLRFLDRPSGYKDT